MSLFYWQGIDTRKNVEAQERAGKDLRMKIRRDIGSLEDRKRNRVTNGRKRGAGQTGQAEQAQAWSGTTGAGRAGGTDTPAPLNGYRNMPIRRQGKARIPRMT